MESQDFPEIVSSFDNASNEMLAAVLEQSIDCIKVIGPTGGIEFMNRNGRCAMEIDDFAMVAGKNWWDLWPGDAEHNVREAFERGRNGESSRFQAFCPTAKGTPRWWDVSVSPLHDGKGQLQGLVSVSRDITEQVRAQELRAATAEEMKHRLQNAYTLTGAIVMAAAKGQPERQEFASEILERLQRLGIAQAMLLDPASMGETKLDQLLRRLTEPFCTGSCELHIGAVPPVALDEQSARALALVVGELCTNSNKYGALGHGGSIAIDGAEEGELITLRWSETSANEVVATKRDGSAGHALISRALALLGGSMDIAWRPDGLDVALSIRAPASKRTAVLSSNP